jgi:hypothetical protein
MLSAGFAANGRTLITGSSDTTIVLWDIPQLLSKTPGPNERLSQAGIERLWADLASVDAAKAYRALWGLIQDPEQALPFLKQHLQPASPQVAEHIAQLIRALDSDRFEKRESAAKELDRLGDSAEIALRDTLAGQPSAEVRRRIVGLLERHQSRASSPQTLRMLRAIEILEQIGSAEATRMLQTLAKGAPATRLTRDARASLERLARRPLPRPESSR